MSANHSAPIAGPQRLFTPVLAQAPSPPNQSESDPLIAQGTENAIYLGVIVLATIIMGIIGIISGRTKAVILIALFLAGLLIALIMVI